VLEKALLLQRTLLTGKKEPNVAANQLAVEAVNHESDTLDQEIRNLKTELELRRELANNSPMAIIQRHGTRAAGSRGIYEGDPVPDRLDRLQKGNPGGTMNAARMAAPALAVQPARGEGAAVAVVLVAAAVGANVVGIYLVGSVAGWERWLAATRATSWCGGCACTARRPTAGSGCAAGCWRARTARRRGAPAAQRDRRRRRHRGAGSQPADAGR
jgi:hypothetical protein